MDSNKNETGDNCGFIMVKRNRRFKNCKIKFSKLDIANNSMKSDDELVDIEVIMRKLTQAECSIRNCEQLHHFTDALNTSWRLLNEDQEIENCWIKEIVSYGIGRFSKCHQSLHQLALLLELKKHYNVQTHIYDPMFSSIEKEILEKLDLNLINRNEEGKRKVYSNTVFFLPHCPRELFNNLLWINWGLSLSKCIIIGNKHSDIITNTPSSLLGDFHYLTNITPALEEIEIPNVFRFNDVFNDLAVHYFPPGKLIKLPADIWNYKSVPQYTRENLEFIT